MAEINERKKQAKLRKYKVISSKNSVVVYGHQTIKFAGKKYTQISEMQNVHTLLNNFTH